MDEVSKILSTDTKHPSKICKFSPYPSEILQRSNDADRFKPQKRLWSHASEKFIHRVRGGGGGGH